MSDVLDINARRAADALVELRAYAGTDPVKSLVRLLESLEGQYKTDLETVTPDQLIPLQTALRQVAALRRSVLSESFIDCKIL